MYNDKQQRQQALSQYQEAKSLSDETDTELKKLYEHCDTTQAATTRAETDYDNACRQLHKAKANKQPYEQQRQAKNEALTHLSQCRAQAKDASRKFQEQSDIWRKAWRVLQKAKSLLPPPKPNAAVLESAMRHTASRDGLGWGFEHTALEQEKAYRKWLRAATKRLTPPPSDLE
jgi:hypothetical protein